MSATRLALVVTILAGLAIGATVATLAVVRPGPPPPTVERMTPVPMPEPAELDAITGADLLN